MNRSLEAMPSRTRTSKTCRDLAVICATKSYPPRPLPPQVRSAFKQLVASSLQAEQAAASSDGLAPAAATKVNQEQAPPEAPAQAQSASQPSKAEVQARVGGKGSGGLPGDLIAAPVRNSEICDRLMTLLWGNLEEPVAQTVRQVQEAFEALMDISACRHQHAERLGRCRGWAEAVQRLASSAASTAASSQHARHIQAKSRQSFSMCGIPDRILISKVARKRLAPSC